MKDGAPGTANNAPVNTANGQSPPYVASSIPIPSTRLWFLILLIGTFVSCAWQWNSRAGFEPIDCWVAQTAREMYESTDWHGYIIPKFSGETRMQKSPGPYWMVCLTAWLRGTGVDEVAARIPNTLMTLIFVAAIFWLARQIAGDRAAVFSGFIAATSGVVLYWSGRGASDLGVAALMTLSLAAFWIAFERMPAGVRRGLLYLLAYFAAGLGMLYKMPMPLVCVGLPAALYVVVRRRWRLLADPWHLAGLVVFLLPWLPWVLLTIQLEPNALAKWRAEYLDRATGELPNVEEQKRWYWYFFYVGIAFAFAAPYLVSIPGAIWRTMRGRYAEWNRDGAWLLLLWFGGLLVFFSAAAGKETRYFLPAMPPLLIMLGIEMAALFDPRRPATPRRDRFIATIVCVVAPLAAAAVAYLFVILRQMEADDGEYDLGEFLRGYALTVGIFTVGLIACMVLYVRRRENSAFGALVAGTWGTWIAATATIIPLLNSQAPFREFAEQIRDKLTPDQQATLLQIAQQDSRIIWYSNVRFPRVIDQLKMLEMLGGRRDRDREIKLVGEEMVKRLEAEPLVLFVATPGDYLMFFIKAPEEMAAAGRAMPATYTWLAANVGRWDHRYIVFGNKPPPWPQPVLNFPEKFEQRMQEVQRAAAEKLRGSAASQARAK